MVRLSTAGMVPRDIFSLKSRHALITSGDRIGGASNRRLAAEGAKIEPVDVNAHSFVTVEASIEPDDGRVLSGNCSEGLPDRFRHLSC